MATKAEKFRPQAAQGIAPVQVEVSRQEMTHDAAQGQPGKEAKREFFLPQCFISCRPSLGWMSWFQPTAWVLQSGSRVTLTSTWGPCSVQARGHSVMTRKFYPACLPQG